MDRIILKKQKAEIHRLIEKCHLEPANFEWGVAKSNYKSGSISKLSYKDTAFYFRFDFYDDGHYCLFSPSTEQSYEEEQTGYWSNQLSCVERWLQALKDEIETIDPWEHMQGYLPAEAVDYFDQNENTQFSYAQAQQIEGRLNQFRKNVVGEFKLTGKQVEVVDQKINYLIDRVKKLGRIDWRTIFVGTIVSLGMGLAMEPSKMKRLWALARECFESAVKLISV